MTTLQLLDSYINKYEELKEIADIQLQSEYSKSWYATLYQCKSKLAVLKELKKELTKKYDTVLPLGKKKMYLLYGHSNNPIACVDPDLVTLIDVADYWDNPVKFYSKIKYQEYDQIEEESIRFFAARAYLKVVDIESLREAFPSMIFWTSIPTVDNWNAAWKIRTELEDKFRKLLNNK